MEILACDLEGKNTTVGTQRLQTAVLAVQTAPVPLASITQNFNSSVVAMRPRGYDPLLLEGVS